MLKREYAGHELEMQGNSGGLLPRSFKAVDLQDGSYLLGSMSEIEGETYVRLTYGVSPETHITENYAPVDVRLEPVVVNGSQILGKDLVFNWLGQLINGKYVAN